jgi:hypothetical protein
MILLLFLDEKPPIQENLTAKSNDEIAEKPIAPKKSRFTVKTVVKEVPIYIFSSSLD